MKKSFLRVKVRQDCRDDWYDIGIFEGRKILMINVYPPGTWKTLKAAIRNAKAMAKRIGIPYDPEIIKQKGC